MSSTDIEDIIGGSSHIKFRKDFKNYFDKYPFINMMALELLDNSNIHSKHDFNKYFKELHRKYNPVDKIKNSIMIYHLKYLFTMKIINYETLMKYTGFLMSKTCRSLSGILEVAIMTGPGEFSCKYNCYYCPDQKGFARSYIKEEPAVRRAAQNDFDPVEQIYDRLSAYSLNGHHIDKLEIIVLGGTWSNYPCEYQESFIRDTYYASNTFFDIEKRPRLSLEEEKKLNETTLCKIIGLTLETRPDCIDNEEINRFLKYGVTRVQIGIQHTDNYLLKKINRGCTIEDTQNAIRLLKNNGFKILGHLMPNLPFTNPEKDALMFDEMLYNPLNSIDEWKIYPTSVTTTSEKDNTEVYTEIERWFKSGKYVPYHESILMNIILDVKRKIHPYIRISRIFRDIPTNNIIGGATTPHMRQVCQQTLKENGDYCYCIRCREIKSTQIDYKSIKYDVIQYDASQGTEFFISAYVPSEKHPLGNIIGFLRLRIDNSTQFTRKYALVRELHVYGRMTPTYIKTLENTQHKGIGKALLKEAERIAYENSKYDIAIISGVGVRKYYEKQGYYLKGAYMVKSLSWFKLLY